MNATCPYCQSALKKFPARKSKCPQCQNSIFVRTNPNSDSKILLREDQIEKFDAERHAQSEVNRFRHNMQIGDSEWNLATQALATSFGFQPKPRDVLWRVMNERVATTRELHSLKMVYFQMAWMLHGEGKDPKPMIRESLRCELLRYKQEGVPCVQVLATEGCGCAACESTNGKYCTVDTALEQMPLPHEGCTCFAENGRYGFCRCSYVPIVDRRQVEAGEPPRRAASTPPQAKSGCLVLLLFLVAVLLAALQIN